MVLLEPIHARFDPECVAATKERVGSLTIVPRARRGALRRIFDEVIGKVAMFHAWEYSSPQDYQDLANQHFDLLFVTPISTLDFALTLQQPNQRIVAAISDCYTAVLRSDHLNFSSVRELMVSLARRLRGYWMGSVEAKVLSRCDRIIVQTRKDADWLERIGGPELSAKTTPLANGVNESLLPVPLPSQPPPHRVLFVTGNFQAHYARSLEWFIERALPHVRQKVPDLRFRIVGRGLERFPQLLAKVQQDPAVELVGFVPRLADVYADSRVAVAPIFKTYGFMNKVAEALAVGLPVVGDPSAFNGLEPALQAGAGFCTCDPGQFGDIIATLLLDDGAWAKAATQAKAIAGNALTWESRQCDLLSTLRD